jgi:hypothetical protein
LLSRLFADYNVDDVIMPGAGAWLVAIISPPPPALGSLHRFTSPLAMTHWYIPPFNVPASLTPFPPPHNILLFHDCCNPRSRRVACVSVGRVM